ncbi:TlpA family protein disulfide reductase [Flaviaesturariibacter terrae]
MNRILILLALLPALAGAQAKAFTVTGHSDYYNGQKLALLVGVYPLYYNDCVRSKQAGDSVFSPFIPVRNGAFKVSGSLRYPHPLYVSYYDAKKNSGHTSYIYFIDGGNVRIAVDDLATNKELRTDIHSPANEEYRRLKRSFGATVDTLTGAVHDMQAKQRLMRRYISAHPNSYVALWELVFDVAQARTDDDKRSILRNTRFFSLAVQKSNTCRALAADLGRELQLGAGKIFPDLSLAPSVSIAALAKGRRYTLVDFWYSHCRACLVQAPALRELYTRYKDSGFGIIGISVDSREHRGDWLAAIERLQLAWPQYLDENGKEAERISVRSFPANFLLDDKGVILKKDLSPEELKAFLESKLGR